MVKLGFIVEGDTEKILFDSEAFRNYMKSLRIDYVQDIINAGGIGNLLPHNIEQFSAVLMQKGAQKIVIITDLDLDACVTKTIERIKPSDIHKCIVSKKAIEAWFLSDTETMRKYLKFGGFHCEEPEAIIQPFEEIKTLRQKHLNRGVSDKKLLVRGLLNHGLSFHNILKHPNCSSAQYFHKQLTQYSN